MLEMVAAQEKIVYVDDKWLPAWDAGAKDLDALNAKAKDTILKHGSKEIKDANSALKQANSIKQQFF